MNNRYFKVDVSTRFVVNITVGPVELTGYEAIPQSDDHLHVSVGWSHVDGELIDTRAAYRDHRQSIRENGSQSRLTSFIGR
jgi:hypothetical protein